MKKKFDKELLIGLINVQVGTVYDGHKLLKNDITDNSRWSINYLMVFSDPDGHIWGAPYSRGATEQQEELPFEYDGDEPECHQMKAVKKTIIVYEAEK